MKHLLLILFIAPRLAVPCPDMVRVCSRVNGVCLFLNSDDPKFTRMKADCVVEGKKHGETHACLYAVMEFAPGKFSLLCGPPQPTPERKE